MVSVKIEVLLSSIELSSNLSFYMNTIDIDHCVLVQNNISVKIEASKIMVQV